ncbi:lamina-associated polypeptide 2, isoforms alpha/zeta-like [Ahaetulla prasina]|uniref:lamina-associated polypeptide 2, isoforms alpha/zeta-like n=1 Tax=Ahaetulla prasina TaxID=499056 RepID=UPI002647A274|nr:lamina-associated polypeptide 2, isoforms alpha/zeta-like [Ahaetulla prasina]
MGSRSDSSDSPSEAESSPSMEDEQWDQELSEEEGFLPEQPMFKGLFRPHLFKALLSKAKVVTKQGLIGEQGACPEQDPADMLFSEPTVETETVPAPKLFLDMIKKQWEALAALPNMSSLERRFFNTASDLMELLRVPEVDDPVLALASSSATLVEPEEVLKPEDRKLEQEKVPVTDLRTHQDFNKIVAAVEYTADATMSSAKYVAKSIASSVTARRFLWLKNWQADTKRRWRLASVPFKGAKLFGEALEPVLTETKGKKKVLTALSRRGDTRFSPSFRKSYFRPYWGSAFGRYQRGFQTQGGQWGHYHHSEEGSSDKGRSCGQSRRPFRGRGNRSFRRHR